MNGNQRAGEAMETDFAAAVASWEEFYETIAGAAGTMLGLLFVSLAINPKMMSDTGQDARRIWAEQTFHSFLVLLVIALVALIPDQSPAGLGIPLLIVSGQGLIKVYRDARTALQSPDPEWRNGPVLGMFVSPVLGYAFCLLAAVLAFRGDPDAMSWLVAVNFLLMMSALISCWNLLKSLGEQTDKDAQQG